MKNEKEDRAKEIIRRALEAGVRDEAHYPSVLWELMKAFLGGKVR